MRTFELTKLLKIHFLNLNIKKNDNIVIHSDLASFGLYNPNLPRIFFKTLKGIIGKNATIALPLYNTMLDKKKIVDIKNDFGIKENSILSKYFFKKFKFVKTCSVFHSHLIHGNLEKKFQKNKNFNSFGKSSDFDLFYKNNFKLLLFGCDAATGCTYLHHIENKFNTKYRQKKIFKLKLKIKNKIVSKKIIYKVRKKNIYQNFNKIFNLPSIKKITKSNKFHFGKSYLVDIKEFDSLCTMILKRRPNILNL
tara:strand:+ start:1803 stop:2555 length:753 start_codon:yes stop_codon:yes gene_type:complete